MHTSYIYIHMCNVMSESNNLTYAFVCYFFLHISFAWPHIIHTYSEVYLFTPGQSAFVHAVLEVVLPGTTYLRSHIKFRQTYILLKKNLIIIVKYLLLLLINYYLESHLKMARLRGASGNNTHIFKEDSFIFFFFLHIQMKTTTLIALW